jgi:hypothetical protein
MTSGHDPHLWHDNAVHGIALRTADPETDDWTSDLILDIDHIVGGAEMDDGIRFEVSPATLTFHGVTDLEVRLQSGSSDHAVGVALPYILRVEREAVAAQKVHLDRPYYAWRIEFASHPDGYIAFGAWGYTLELRGDPVWTAEQSLTYRQRGGG